MTTELKDLYMLYDEEEGECHGEFETIEEAMETTKCLKARDYFITTSLEKGREIVVTVKEIEEYLTKWDEEEA